MRRAIQVCALFFAFTATASAHHRAIHDAERAIHDVRMLDHGLHDISSADHETAKMWRDAERADGLLTPSFHDPFHEKNDELSKAEHDLRDAEKAGKDIQKAECDRLHAEYTLRHPPGTKPKGLSGLHGCSLWRQDAQFHDTHPDIVSVLGANMYVGIAGAHVSF